MDPLFSEFPCVQHMTVLAYQKGVWTDRIRIEKSEDGWRSQGSRRDPWTFEQRPVEPLALCLRGNGNLEVAFANGTKMVWESPTRLIRITSTGRRRAHVSEWPILQFSPELLAVNRILLKAYLSSRPAEAFSVAALEDGKLVPYSFVRAERNLSGAEAESQAAWRWAGAKPSYPKMCQDADLALSAPFDLLMSDEGDLLGWVDPMQDHVTVVEGVERLSPVALWQKEDVSAPRFTTVTLAEKCLMPMQDGVRLAATILVPGDADSKPLPGPFPAVLIRSPYGRKLSLQDAFKFVSRGYVVVSQDVRGRGDSEGQFNAIHDDIGDGDGTLNWIAAQSWSDGRVGMIGGSYLGWVQWQAACSRNPHLKTMICIVPTFSAFGDLPYVNGMFCAGMLTWSIFMSATAERAAQAMGKDLNAIASELPLIEADIRAVGHEIPFWRQWVTHARMDDYWQPGNVLNYQDRIDLPVLHIVGWYDDVLRGTMSAYDMMKANGRANQQLLVGPWPHAINSVRSLAELSFGPDSCRPDMHYGYVRWFDRWLKGIDNQVESDPAVRYFTMGENKWHTADSWPPRHTAQRKWYLHSAIGEVADDSGCLSTRPPAKAKDSKDWDHYTHDPANPVPYLVDIRANQLSVPEDYQEVEHRPDVLVYTTHVFAKPFEITGESMAVLYAATDQKDTDWVVRLTDVFPDGRSINLIDGYLRARFRNGMENEELVTPGEVIEYRIPMTWTSYRFAEGHRMRVLIASAAAGAFVVNTNTGNSVATDTEIRVAHQRIYRSEQYPSHIEMSVPQDSGP